MREGSRHVRFALLITPRACPLQGSSSHRVIRKFMCEGGAFSAVNGTGGELFFGVKFADENFDMKHTDSAAYPWTTPAPGLTDPSSSSVVDGRDVVRAIEKVGSGLKPVVVAYYDEIYGLHFTTADYADKALMSPENLICNEEERMTRVPRSQPSPQQQQHPLAESLSSDLTSSGSPCFRRRKFP
ncbi:Peptidyl-prolyl cis-trans isomerase 1 [Linum perenne]